jgi:hypothetical protein
MFRQVTLSVILLSVLFQSIPARAQNMRADTPPPPVNINVPLIMQDSNTWCWLAVTEMILRTRQNQSLRQCEILELWDRLPSGSCCVDRQSCSRSGIDLHEVAALLERFGRIYTRYSATIPPNTLYSLISAGLPVIVQIRKTSGATHALVIRGLRFERDHSRENGWQMIIIFNDPQNTTPQEMPYSELVIGWLDSLVVER